MTESATRARAFGLIADGVAAGLSAPWRLYLARGCRYLSLNVGDRAEWDSWRVHLGCPELSVRVYDAGGGIRRDSVAGGVLDGCRISVELVEEIDTSDLKEIPVRPDRPIRAHPDRSSRGPGDRDSGSDPDRFPGSRPDGSAGSADQFAGTPDRFPGFRPDEFPGSPDQFPGFRRDRLPSPAPVAR